jgi:hypothetical protein
MTDFVVPALAPTTVSVVGSTAVFPVGRVYCIGRNYRWRQDEVAPADMPPWFMKPANAVVPAHGVVPYPPGTTDFCHEIELVVAIGRGGRNIDPAKVESHHIWGTPQGWTSPGATSSSKPSTQAGLGRLPKPLTSRLLARRWCRLQCAATRDKAPCGWRSTAPNDSVATCQTFCGQYPNWWQCCHAR